MQWVNDYKMFGPYSAPGRLQDFYFSMVVGQSTDVESTLAALPKMSTLRNNQVNGPESCKKK